MSSTYKTYFYLLILSTLIENKYIYLNSFLRYLSDNSAFTEPDVVLTLTTMRGVCLFSLLSCCLAASLDPAVEFVRFKSLHGKIYETPVEEEVRFNQFKDNLAKIEKHNAEDHSWKLGITKFADLSK